MKLQLIRKVDTDRVWYHIWKDHDCIKSFGVYRWRNDEATRKEAEKYFDEIVKSGGEKIETVIKSVDL